MTLGMESVEVIVFDVGGGLGQEGIAQVAVLMCVHCIIDGLNGIDSCLCIH